jgi:hypothetical protein
MDPFKLPDETPLKPVFSFDSFDCNGPYNFARVSVSIAPEASSMGFFTASLKIPIANAGGETLEALQKQALELAQRAIDVNAILPLLRRPR